MKIVNILTILALSIITILPTGNCQSDNQPAGSQQPAATLSPEDKLRAESIKDAFERAMRDVDAAKLKEQEELTAELKHKLKTAIDEWLHAQRTKKAAGLNKFVDQSWEKMAKRIAVEPVRYNYYLRDFAYYVAKSDITKTDSLAAPYKANVLINEYMYLEKYHSPSISYRRDYFYTVLTPITLNFEYHNGIFVVTGSQESMISMTKGAPPEVETRILKQTFD